MFANKRTNNENGLITNAPANSIIANTGRIKAFAATRHSATNWLGDTENDSLQRMYGIAFPDKKMLKVWKENQEKVSKNRTKERSVYVCKCGGD